MTTARRWLPIVAGIAVLLVFLGHRRHRHLGGVLQRAHHGRTRHRAHRGAAAAFDDAKRQLRRSAAGGGIRRSGQAALRRGHRDPQERRNGDHRARAGLGSRRAGVGDGGAADVAAAPEVGSDRVRDLRQRPRRPRRAASRWPTSSAMAPACSSTSRRRRASASSFPHSSALAPTSATAAHTRRSPVRGTPAAAQDWHGWCNGPGVSCL